MACFRSWNSGTRRDFIARPQDYDKSKPEPHEKYQKFRCTGAELDDGEVFVAGMVCVSAVALTTSVFAMMMRRVAVAMSALAVNMCALRSANIAPGIDVHVQSAQLHGEQAETSGQDD